MNGVNTNVLFSASWDKTVRGWTLSESGTTCSLKIQSHQATVWAVLQMKQNLLVTASADKTVKVFHPNGDCIKTLGNFTVELLNDKKFLIEYFS